MGDAVKEEHCLYLVSEHVEGDYDVKGSGSINLQQAFHGCSKVQVR